MEQRLTPVFLPPAITPTAWLAILTLSYAQTPMGLIDLCIATGAPAGTLEKLLRKLVRDGYLIRTSGGYPHLYALSAAVM